MGRLEHLRPRRLGARARGWRRPVARGHWRRHEAQSSRRPDLRGEPSRALRDPGQGRRVRRWSFAHAVAVSVAVTACARSAESPRSTDDADRLPTGVRLDPAGRSVDVGSMPLAMTLSPDGRHVVLLLNGWREQGLQILDRATGAVVQTVPQAAAFIGIGFSPNGRALFISGGNQDVIYGYDWDNGRATLRDSVILAWKENPRRAGTRYPAGLAVSPDGTRLYVAENLADSLAVIDLGTGAVLSRHATERYPYGVVVAPNGNVYVSAWGGHTVSGFTSNGSGGLHDGARERSSRRSHPGRVVSGSSRFGGGHALGSERKGKRHRAKSRLPAPWHWLPFVAPEELYPRPALGNSHHS